MQLLDEILKDYKEVCNVNDDIIDKQKRIIELQAQQIELLKSSLEDILKALKK